MKSIKKGYSFRKNELNQDDIIKLLAMANNGVSKVELGKIFNISRASVYRYLNINV